MPRSESKKRHKDKHKDKHKKSKDKSKKHKRRSSKSSPPKGNETKEAKRPENQVTERDAWMISVPKREKPLPKKEDDTTPEPTGYHAPQLAEQGTDNDDISNDEFMVGSGGANWRRAAIRRAREQAEEDNVDFKEQLKDRWGKDAMRRVDRSERRGGWRKGNERDRRSNRRSDDRGYKSREGHGSAPPRRFMRPGEMTSNNRQRSPSPDRRDRRYPPRDSDRRSRSRSPDRGGRKRSRSDYETEDRNVKKEEKEIKAPPVKQVDPELLSINLNKLVAQIAKADIMGKTELKKELEEKLARAREAQDKAVVTTNTSTGEKFVIIPDIDAQGRSRSALEKSLESDSGDRRKKKRRVETHSRAGRERYYHNDDVDLNDLVAREKRGGAEDYDTAYAEQIMRNNKYTTMSEDDMWEQGHKEWDNKKKKTKERQRRKAISDTKKYDQVLEKCQFCWSKIQAKEKHMVLGLGNHVYLKLTGKGLFVPGHLQIATLEHHLSITTVDQEIWDEIKLFMASVTRMYAASGKEVIFFETVTNYKWQRHLVVECIPMDRSAARDAPLYFKKALNDSESKWATHIKVIDTTKRGIRRCIPPNFAYFYVQFGLARGYAHQIEDPIKWPKHFGKSIIGGILGMQEERWKHPERLTYEQEIYQMKELVPLWNKYDWTTKLDGGNY